MTAGQRPNRARLPAESSPRTSETEQAQTVEQPPNRADALAPAQAANYAADMRVIAALTWCSSHEHRRPPPAAGSEQLVDLVNDRAGGR